MSILLLRNGLARPGRISNFSAAFPYFEYIKNMEEKDIVRALAALAHQLRLRVVRMLVVAGPQGLTPGAIAAQLDVPNATLSFHLKELMNAGLVTQERDGRTLIYRATCEQMSAVLAFLTENCCERQPGRNPHAGPRQCSNATATRP